MKTEYVVLGALVLLFLNIQRKNSTQNRVSSMSRNTTTRNTATTGNTGNSGGGIRPTTTQQSGSTTQPPTRKSSARGVADGIGQVAQGAVNIYCSLNPQDPNCKA